MLLRSITPDYAFDGKHIPAVSASASHNQAGRVHLSLVNAHPHESITITTTIAGHAAKSVSGRVLTADAMNARNTFDATAAIAPHSFDGAKLGGDTLTVTLPAKSVVVLAL